MKTIPIEEFKNPTKIAKKVCESNEPFSATKDGHSEFVIMNVEVYKRIFKK